MLTNLVSSAVCVLMPWSYDCAVWVSQKLFPSTHAQWVEQRQREDRKSARKADRHLKAVKLKYRDRSARIVSRKQRFTKAEETRILVRSKIARSRA